MTRTSAGRAPIGVVTLTSAEAEEPISIDVHDILGACFELDGCGPSALCIHHGSGDQHARTIVLDELDDFLLQVTVNQTTQAQPSAEDAPRAVDAANGPGGNFIALTSAKTGQVMWFDVHDIVGACFKLDLNQAADVCIHQARGDELIDVAVREELDYLLRQVAQAELKAHATESPEPRGPFVPEEAF